MPRSSFESRILELARFKGILQRSDLDSLRNVEVGQRISVLIERGLLDESVVESLTLELLNAPAPTLMHADQDFFEGLVSPESLTAWKGYADLQPLGMGGGGMVYRAKDTQLDRWVALKFPRDSASNDLARLLREARAQARVDHPNVVKVHEVGEFEGQFYIAMQFIQGTTLLEMSSALTLEQKIHVIMQVADGLHEAHQQGLVHLDIKPANILVEQTDKGDVRPYLTDFGLVRDESRGSLAIGRGTPGFASPEQLSGDVKNLDRRSDVYSLGATFYFLLAGVGPFDGCNLDDLAKAEPIPLRQRDSQLPSDLEAITQKCMNRLPANRYDSAQQVVEELTRFLAGEVVHARKSSRLHATFLWLRRHRVSISVWTLASMLAGLGFWSLRNFRQAAEKTHLAIRYGQEVQEVEETLRRAHLSRIHDRRASVHLVRNTMARIKDEMVQLGPNAQGPGSLALGEGCYALGEINHAKEYLDQAWAAGFRTPACAQLRGQVLANIYLREKSLIHGDTPEARWQALQRLQVQLRDPALACFRLAKDASLNTPYQQAMEAYLKEDLDRAIACAQEASVKAPWFYEANVLCHNLHLEKKRVFLSDGKGSDARMELEAAGKALEQALDIAPSDPSNWENRGWWFLELSDFPDLPKNQKLSAIHQAIEVFKTALKVDPDAHGSYDGLSEAYGTLADETSEQGRDPMVYFKQALEYAEAGNQKTPPSDINPELGWALLNVAEERLRRGEDSRPELDRAITHLSKLEKRSHENNVVLGLEVVNGLRGLAAFCFSEDPIPYCTASIRWADEDAKIGPENPVLLANTLNCRTELAEMEIRTNRSPTTLMGPVVQGLEELVKSSDQITHRVYLTQALRVLALQKVASGEDPLPAFKACRDTSDAALKVQPKDLHLLESIAAWAMVYGQWQSSRGEDPEPTLQHGLEAVRVLRTMRPLEDYPKTLELSLRMMKARCQGRTDEALRLGSNLHSILSRNRYAAALIGSLQIRRRS